MTFGGLLKQARLNKGYTQKQLAEKIKAKHNSVSNWENDQNKPDPDTIEYLCGVLNVPANYFFPSSATNSNIAFKELGILEKYRKLDNHGIEMVNAVLSMEYKRCVALEAIAEDEPDNV